MKSSKTSNSSCVTSVAMAEASAKRTLETEDAVNSPTTERPQKRIRGLPASPRRQRICPETATGISASQRRHISHWAVEQDWPKEFFQKDRIHHLLARPRSAASPSHNRSESSLATFMTLSDEYAEKNTPYSQPYYVALLEQRAGSYMHTHELGITKESEVLCQSLFESKQTIPTDTIFRDNIFANNCQRLQSRNKARIFKDCTPLLVPAAEAHAMFSSNHDLDILTESVSEGWHSSIPLTWPVPHPDYAVGFKRSAFSDDQIKKLEPFFGDPLSSCSFFMGTYYMHFPFLTCEVKCGSVSLEVADRQNLHSMTLAVRGVVELFRMAKCVELLHREVLAFSVSHNDEAISIYGHFPVIEGVKTTYWRCMLRSYYFTAREGREKWTAYTFTKNLYDIWVPIHFRRISSAVDALSLEQILKLSTSPPLTKKNLLHK